MRAEPERSPLDETDRLLIRHLRTCRFLPASADKRFAHSVGRISDMAAGMLSSRQRSWLSALVYRYRRQIPATVVAKAALRLAEEQAAFRLAPRGTVPVATGASTPVRNPLDDLFTEAR